MPAVIDIDARTADAACTFLLRAGARYELGGAYLFDSRARYALRADSDADAAVLLRGSQGCFVATKLDMDDIAGVIRRAARYQHPHSAAADLGRRVGTPGSLPESLPAAQYRA